MEASSGLPYPLGATAMSGGTNFAVASEIADVVEICLVDEDGERRIELPARTADVFHGFIPDVGVGQQYGIRVQGPWNPSEGLRCNPAKFLIDPYARAIAGEITWGQEVFGHRFDAPDEMDDSDSINAMPRSIVVDNTFDWEDDSPPAISLDETIVYETHVKGLTALHPEIPWEIRGTYAGLGHPAMTSYLRDLGVTAIELLPVQEFVHDEALLERGLRNYWGYNSTGFFAPHYDYASSGSEGSQVVEFKTMVKNLHKAGLEVILDVVYNHTAEGNEQGPTLSMKGIDNPSYYRLAEGDAGHYFDTTGTGNSFNVGHPIALRLIMDSLRYWVEEMHVDGFRFDLATTLTRQKGETDIHSAFLDLVGQDPVLASVKLIAEPWDISEFQLGGFPARWSEWNGQYRDTVRDFWKGDATVGEFALCLTGSGDIYSSRRRMPTASINFVTAHDGFTLSDLTSYNDKHNEANGEENRDGSDDNHSWNCGVEGATADPGINSLRLGQHRAMLATLLLSAGVPMLLGGDEIGRSQNGNNNGYCQDNEISWYDWKSADSDLLAFTQKLIEIRKRFPALRPREYLRGSEGGVAQMVLYRPDGNLMEDGDWSDPQIRTLAVALDGRRIADEEGNTTPDRLLLCVNAHYEPVEFTLPGTTSWTVVTDSADVLAGDLSGMSTSVAGRSLVLLERDSSEAK